jgi:fatty-acyl-CoA synthase
MTTQPGPTLAISIGDATAVPLMQGSVADALHRAAERFPERPAIVWAEGDGFAQLTYSQMLAEAQAIAWWLLARAQPGDRVAIWSRNSLEWLLAEYGCALAGLVISAWNTPWKDPECVHACDLTDPRLILADCDTRGVDLLERARGLADGREVAALKDIRALAAQAQPRPLPPVAASDPYLIQFTSGTTGRSKGALLSNRAALNSAWIRARLHGTDETDVWLNPVPFTHVGGAISIVLGTLSVGAAYVMVNRFDPGEVIRLIRGCGVTRLGGVPTMMMAVLDHPDRGDDLKLRAVGSGGAQVPGSLIERIQKELGAPVTVVYGQSESPMATASMPGDPPRCIIETVGRVTPHVELKICDPLTGDLLAIGDVGEICIRSPVTMDGYWRQPEATAAAFRADGFLRTGDLGSLDAEGFVRIHGRARDVIIRGGENIYPAEVEDVMLAHPAIEDIAVVGIPDARLGQVVAAAVILRPGAEADSQALEAFAAERLSHFKVPRTWRFETALPMTASGKVRKVDVEKLFEG